MHKLERSSEPSCLARFRHGFNHWDDVLAADKNDIWQQALEFNESEWMPLLQQELEAIKNQPFATAIKHVFAP